MPPQHTRGSGSVSLARPLAWMTRSSCSRRLARVVPLLAALALALAAALTVAATSARDSRVLRGGSTRALLGNGRAWLGAWHVIGWLFTYETRVQTLPMTWRAISVRP